MGSRHRFAFFVTLALATSFAGTGAAADVADEADLAFTLGAKA
jgi:hypothetical protein